MEDLELNRRTALVVQGCRLPVFEASLAAQRSTWASKGHPNVDVWFGYGNGCDCHQLSDLHLPNEPTPPVAPEGEVLEHGDLLLIGCSDLIAHRSDSLLQKRLLSLAHLLETDDHDAFLLICASSYINLDVLARHVETMRTDLVFQGPTFIAESGRPIVSGSAMLLSRDLAEQLVAATPALLANSSYRYADDVSISDWVAANISDTSTEEMVQRLESGEPATTDNTFIQPPSPMLNFREMSADEHQPVDAAYQYHFATDEPQTMRDFHAKYFQSALPSVEEATIFIQIASYRDSDLPRTIASAIEKADNADRLRFGICWQWDEKTLEDLDQYTEDERFRIDEIYYRKSDGCTWARNRANRLYAGEDYYLQIDAHMRFEPGWDTTLITMLEAIDAPKPVLTVYPPAFETDGDGNDTFHELHNVHVLSLASISESLQTRQATLIAPDQFKPGKSPFIAAGFLFAHGSFCAEIPYDPFGYYSGEEISLAARAYTTGYDFFYPTKTVVWHRYSHGEPLHWGDKPDTWSTAELRSRDRLVTLLVGDHKQLSPYGLGSVRTIAEFEDYCGISFQSAREGGGAEIADAEPS